MSSDSLLRHPAVRRALPWGLWAVALVALLAMGLKTSGIGLSPAVTETRSVALKCPRTAHRLKVAQVLVSPADSVKAGQVLVRMEPGEVDADLAIERAKLLEQERKVVSLRAKLTNDRARLAGQFAVDAEKGALDAARLSAENERDRSELSQLDEGLRQEQVLVDEKLANFERLNALKLRRAALARKAEEDRGTVERARASASGAAQRLEGWRKTAMGKSAAEAAEHLLELLAPAEAAAEAQHERVRRLERLRGELELKAPFDGRVGEVLLRPGETAASVDAVVVTVVDDRPTTAVAYVDQRWANRVQVGDRAKLIPRDVSGPARWGTVTALGPAIAELPVRFRHFPNVREYGRNVFIKLEAQAALPGQAFDATFRPASGAGGAR